MVVFIWVTHIANTGDRVDDGDRSIKAPTGRDQRTVIVRPLQASPVTHRIASAPAE
jgi:hypothetical protein